MHASTDRRDKIYALLGLSTDFSELPTLWADYSKPRSVLLHDVVTHFLGPTVMITIWDEKEEAVIVGSGCLLGKMSISPIDRAISFQSLHFVGIRSSETNWTIAFPLSSYEEHIQNDDIICLLEGAQYPSSVRRRRNYFSVVEIALTPPPDIVMRKGQPKPYVSTVSWETFSQFIRIFPSKFFGV
jgi:hypothetical protein